MQTSTPVTTYAAMPHLFCCCCSKPDIKPISPLLCFCFSCPAANFHKKNINLAINKIWVPWALNRWRFRHIPGPWAPPVLGNLLRLAQHDLHGYLELCRKRHGTLFKVP